jgi:hypothetical protein
MFQVLFDGTKAASTAPAGVELNHISSELYSLQGRASIEASGWGAKGNLTEQSWLVIHEAAHYREVDLSDKDPPIKRGDQRVVRQRFGVSLRLVVEVSDLKFEFNLSLPLIAAAADANLCEAHASLLIMGYKGDLAAQLPKPQRLTGETIDSYLTGVSKLQDVVFKTREDYDPVLLGEQYQQDVNVLRHSGRWAVAFYVTLERMTGERQSLKQLKTPYKNPDEIAGVEAAWLVTGAEDGDWNNVIKEAGRILRGESDRAVAALPED